MQWSRLRSTLEGRFAPALGGRVSLHQARYRHANEEIGRIWFTVDGREVAAFATGARWRRVREAADRLIDAPGGPSTYEAAVADAAAALRESGVPANDDALDELEAFLSMPIDEALAAPSALSRVLAVLDARVGKRRLATLLREPDADPAVRAMLELRCATEGVRVAPPAA